MTPQERAEIIVLATRQDRYAKATVLLEFIAAQIEEAEREAVRTSVNTFSLTKQEVDKCYAEGYRAARDKAKGIAEEHGKRIRFESSHEEGFHDGADTIAQCIGELEP